MANTEPPAPDTSKADALRALAQEGTMVGAVVAVSGLRIHQVAQETIRVLGSGPMGATVLAAVKEGAKEFPFDPMTPEGFATV